MTFIKGIVISLLLAGSVNAATPPTKCLDGQIMNAKGLCVTAPQKAPAKSCPTKRPYCKNIKSCGEARRLLTECHFDELDSDGDGIPCEALCIPK